MNTTTPEPAAPAGTLSRALQLIARFDAASPSAVQQNPDRFRMLAEQASASAAFVQARAAEVRMLVAVLSEVPEASILRAGRGVTVIRSEEEYDLIVERIRALIGLTEPTEAGE